MKILEMADVLSVINKIEGVDILESQANTAFDELDIDSLLFVVMIAEIEESFQCEIPDSRLIYSQMNTVEKITNVLRDILE